MGSSDGSRTGRSDVVESPTSPASEKLKTIQEDVYMSNPIGYGTNNPMGLNEALGLSQVWSEDERDQTRSTILKAFAEDSSLKDATNISIEFRDEEGRYIHVIGKVPSELEKRRAIEIVMHNTATDTHVVDELKVQN
jgi:hypothetical protein